MRNLAYIAQRKNESADRAGGGGVSTDDPFPEPVYEQAQEKKPEEKKLELETEKVEGAPEEKKAEAAETEKVEGDETKEEPLLDDEGNPIVKNEITIDDLGGDKTAAKTEEDQAGWKDVGSLVGLELAEDTEEAFLAADAIRTENIRKQAVAEHLVKVQKMNPEAARLVEAFNNGATELGIYKVEEPYRDFLAFSPEEKVKQALIAANHTEEYAQRVVDKHIEEGTLDDEVKRLDTNVKDLMKGKVQEYFEGVKANASAQNQKTLDRIANENKLVEQAILSRNKFLNFDVSEEVRKQIIARWNNGTYRQAFESDPNAVVDFIFERELGAKARSLAVSKETREFREGVQDKLQTLGQARQASTAKQGVNAKIRSADVDDPFAAWGTINSNEVQTTITRDR